MIYLIAISDSITAAKKINWAVAVDRAAKLKSDIINAINPEEKLIFLFDDGTVYNTNLKEEKSFWELENFESDIMKATLERKYKKLFNKEVSKYNLQDM